MDVYSYVDLLKQKYTRYFDIKENTDILGQYINLFTRFNIVNSRTFITKNDVIDSYSNNEYCFVKIFENPSIDDLNSYCSFLKKCVDKFVKPDRNHMSTIITGVIVCTKCSEDLKKVIKKFKFKKPYKFYLHGWSEVRLILYDAGLNTVAYNGSGAAVKNVYKI